MLLPAGAGSIHGGGEAVLKPALAQRNVFVMAVRGAPPGEQALYLTALAATVPEPTRLLIEVQSLIVPHTSSCTHARGDWSATSRECSGSESLALQHAEQWCCRAQTGMPLNCRAPTNLPILP